MPANLRAARKIDSAPGLERLQSFGSEMLFLSRFLGVQLIFEPHEKFRAWYYCIRFHGQIRMTPPIRGPRGLLRDGRDRRLLRRLLSGDTEGQAKPEQSGSSCFGQEIHLSHPASS
jgi:hypothetical protein